MDLTIMDNYDLLVMKIIHYFIVKENYSPIIIKGIEEFNSLRELLKEVVSRFNKMCIDKYNLKESDTVIYEYDVPKFNISGKDFFTHCENGTKISI